MAGGGDFLLAGRVHNLRHAFLFHDPEVRDAQFALLCQQQIARLDIPMHLDAVFMGIAQAVTRLDQQIENPIPLAGFDLALTNPIPQAAASKVVHEHARDAA